VSMGVRLFPAVHGHIADSVRDHGPGLVAHLGGSLVTGKRERAVHRTACSWISMPAVLGEEPSGSRKITGGSRVWPTGSMGTHESPADIGVSLWTDHAGRQPAPAWSAHGCRMQRPATDKPASSWSAPVSAGLLLTWDVPAVDLSCTSRDGTDDGERSKGPVTCAA
jgi:hypothetical protein